MTSASDQALEPGPAAGAESDAGTAVPRLQEVRRTLLAENVTEQLMAMIRSGQIGLGERVPPEHVLMEQLKVGRSSVREALRGLALIGLIERRPRRGTVVVSTLPKLPGPLAGDAMAKWALRDLFEARALIEGFAAERAADLATVEELEGLRRQAAAIERKIAAGERYFVENNAFHATIVRLARNRVLAHLHEEVVSALPDLRKRFETARDIEEHRGILEALEARDGALARRRLVAHVEGVLEPPGS
ncbi:MAG: FCD domain-containing protein [Geminicoccaceae bacterium]